MGKKGKFNKNNQAEEEEPRKKKIMITEEHLMDKTHMDDTQFLPLLQQDSFYPPFAFHTLDILKKVTKDLNYLLYLRFKNFWATLLYNPTVKNCLNSCLKYLHRKWLNDYYSEPSQRREYYELIKDRDEFELVQALMKIVLILHYRMLNCEAENPELTDLYHLKEQISKKYLLDFPRLMELIEVYGKSNPDVTKIIVRSYLKINESFYRDFVEEYMEIIMEKMNKDLFVLKKTSDREEFGIQYSYKRSHEQEKSPGEQELEKKICLLMEFISFYDLIDNMQDYFPERFGEYPRFSEAVHTFSENLFIEMELAYRSWNNHDTGDRIYNLMNVILSKIVRFFVDFLDKCDNLFVKKTHKTNTMGAYLKCLDRMMQFYGRRASLGKKGSSSKRYMDLYKQVLKTYKLDEFLAQLYIDEMENGTLEINVEYLVDFKLAVDEEMIKMNGGRREIDNHEGLGEAGYQEEERTEAGLDDNQDKEDPFHEPIRKQSMKSIENLDHLEKLISKKNRSNNYYDNLYNDYRSKYTMEYDDEYDDLVDYEKRPMFEDNEKEEGDSSDYSFDSEDENLHLVKSVSNVSRNRAHLTAQVQKEKEEKRQKLEKVRRKEQEKYDRKNKAKYVPVKKEQMTSMSQVQEPQGQKKEQKRYQQKNKEYEDEECLQDCKVKIKLEDGDERNGEKNRSENSNNRQERGRNNQNRGKNYEGEKGKNKNKKYVAKEG